MNTDCFVAFFTGILVGMALGVMVTSFLIVIRQNDDRAEIEARLHPPMPDDRNDGWRNERNDY